MVLPNVQSYRLERERRYFGFLTKRGQLCVRVWSRATYNSETADDPDDPNPIVKVIRPFYAVSSEDAIHKAADILRREMGIDIDPVEALKRNQRGE